MKEARAHIEMHFDTPREAEVVYLAVSVERDSSRQDRAEADLRLEGETLLLDIHADDAAAFRAAMNSYSMWIKTSSSLM